MAKRSRAPTTGTAASPAAASAKRTRLSQPSSQRSLSPRQALAVAPSQATTFESELLESQPEAEIVAPTEGSQAGTAATTEAGGGDGDDDRDGDSYNGIKWERLRGFMKPFATQRRNKVGYFNMAIALLSVRT
ncbi:hypothetical protein P3342_011828 [Pyrenophora teres f. teres]|nr:hypothetical protein P3342_011828 [Pyrenophora teres f. teres]